MSEFLLNLIPFRSAIVSFQNGQYGAGAFDLLLDVFGFLTTGAATAGKLLKVGRSALSTGVKALRAAKVIGVAAIDMLNPVGGVGDLPRLVGSAGLYVLSKGVKAVNKLRGATGSYDVLKAISKQYEAAATGTVKVAGQTVEGAAVLKGGKWYSFDVDAMRPYGGPLDEFKAATQAVDGEVDTASFEGLSELSHELFGHFKVPESQIAGLPRNSQGVYVAADGHSSHIRHTDSNGDTAVYEVRQVSRTEDGTVQARVYHNNRQTELLVQHVQGDEWQRLGAPGGGQITAEHLRAWELLPRREQETLTPRGFAKKNNLPIKTFEYYVKPGGQLSDTGVIVRDRPVDTPLKKVTKTHINDWQSLTQEKRNAMTMDGFAGQHHISAAAFRAYVRADGSLGPSGQALLNRVTGVSHQVITDEHLRQWKKLLEKPDNVITPEAFIRQHKLSPNSWKIHVRSDGSFKEETLQRLNSGENTVRPPARRQSKMEATPPIELNIQMSGARQTRITAAHLRAWVALPRDEQLKVTPGGFARRHFLNQNTFEYYVKPDGQLSATGVIVHDRAPNTPFNKVTHTHLLAWQNMLQRDRAAMTMEGFAGHHQLSPSTFKNLIRADGSLRPIGEALQNQATGIPYNRITDDHLCDWQKQSGQPGNSVTPEKFIQKHGLNPGQWANYVRADGSFTALASQRLGRLQQGIEPRPVPEQPAVDTARKRPATDPLDPPQPKVADMTPHDGTPHGTEVPGPSSAVPPVVIKVEPSEFPTLPRHHIDNTLPILQDPDNPRLSLTRALEGPIDDIRITHWNGLLDGLDNPTKQRVSAQIKASIKDWLRTEGQHQPRFDQTLEVVTALEDGGPARGASVWARRDIAQFEVLGPYAGKYHATETSLFQEQRKQGSRAVLTYLFGTRSGNRSVSALHTGNTLSLINTSQLGDGPAWKANNVISIAVGKNLTFYVALNDIKKGDELLVDYGPLYKPVPDVAIKPERSR
ncbi:SET domain-containing protein-lysine N-methyltransferase [Pseudomonas sp. AM4(2022)]|uniref:SET domain-containing protein-lysine N-methyltransferase n=1 Tax=Pseudomonas sp. AM4(2022) TaxID=2983408 RepID=UPI002E82019C|nr:SET domain-containing protein-lysine N-methyltransferase [Pseudomonas sp. AM4(2022)]